MGLSYNSDEVEALLKEHIKTLDSRIERGVNLAADYLIKELKAKADSTFHRSGRQTGKLGLSIGKGEWKDGGIDVYPKGKRRKNLNEAGLGAILEYGRSNMPGTAWYSTTEERCAPRVREIIEEEMRKDA